jgi:hypothetical protein
MKYITGDNKRGRVFLVQSKVEGPHQKDGHKGNRGITIKMVYARIIAKVKEQDEGCTPNI